MSSLREAQKQLTRDVIVERALELFTEKGYAATTIDEIAAAAGTTRVTFYAYYPTRSDLMRDFMARVNGHRRRAQLPDPHPQAAPVRRRRSGRAACGGARPRLTPRNTVRIDPCRRCEKPRSS
ncbi:helix-turn-helix domain-containing protein [Arthrobacter sp. I3]|uniref:TetR/AcrR family transcriptional regulator n=1 Tax=Arthrobacter sp. I3 TaxID=218158 RepID=UPI0004B6BF32|nr:helix-turn-helix domain-containing protein [Arthrobacter sp. I3]